MRVGPAYVSAVSLAFVIAVATSCGRRESAEKRASPTPAQAIRPLPDEAFRVEWSANTVAKVMKAGASTNVSVTFKNVSSVTWPDPRSTGYEPPEAGAVRLAYRWWSASAPTPISEARLRTDLERPVQPGQAITLNLAVTAPPTRGEYRLQFDLVQELVAWFEAKGSPPFFVAVRVQ